MKCTALRKDGHPCRQEVLQGDTLCIWHNPARKADALALLARAREAADETWARRRLSEQEVPPTLDGSLASISARQTWVLDRQAAGMMTERAAQTQLTGLRDLRESLVKENLERQVKALRTQLETAQRKIARSTR